MIRGVGPAYSNTKSAPVALRIFERQCETSFATQSPQNRTSSCNVLARREQTNPNRTFIYGPLSGLNGFKRSNQMDKKITALLGAAAALSTMNSAQASPNTPSSPTEVKTYSDLLAPIPGALELLKADDARLAERSTEGAVKLAQNYHHHHHHHGYNRIVPRVFVRRPHHHHHHHHHHQQGFSIQIR